LLDQPVERLQLQGLERLPRRQTGLADLACHSTLGALLTLLARQLVQKGLVGVVLAGSPHRHLAVAARHSRQLERP